MPENFDDDPFGIDAPEVGDFAGLPPAAALPPFVETKALMRQHADSALAAMRGDAADPVAAYTLRSLLDVLRTGDLPALSTGSVEQPGDMVSDDLVAVAVALDEVAQMLANGKRRALDELAKRMDESASTSIPTRFGTAKRGTVTPKLSKASAAKVRTILENAAAAELIPADVPDNLAPLEPNVSTPKLIAWVRNHVDRLGADAASFRMLTPERGPGAVSIDRDSRVDDEAVPS